MAQYDELGKFIVEVLRTVWRFARRNSLVLLGSAGLVALVTLGWSAFQSSMTRDIIILGGPAGGTGESEARRVADYLQEASSKTVFGRHYQVRVENTGGYTANFQRIESNGSGNVIGFGHDGFEDGTRVRELLPVDKQYLHVICRRDFYAPAVGKNASELTLDKPPTLTDIQATLETCAAKRQHNVFLGPLGSGTRRIAEKVLRHYNLKPEQLSAHGIADWIEFRAAIRKGDVVVGFILDEQGAKNVSDIAEDGECLLLSVDNASAVCEANPQLTAKEFAMGSYKPTFCPQPVQTVSAKRVLMCSSLMSATDAFYLAQQLQLALGISKVGWSQDQESDRTYPLHPGASILEQSKRPNWLEGVSFIWLTFGVWIALSAVTEIARKANLWLTKSRTAGATDAEAQPASIQVEPGAAAPTPSPPAYALFVDTIEREEKELRELPEAVPRRDYVRRERNIRSLLENLKKSHHCGQLDDKSFEVLRRGVLALAGELNELHKVTSQKSAPRTTRRKGHASTGGAPPVQEP